MGDDATHGFTRPLALADLPAGGRTFAIRASASECRRLARWLALEALSDLSAEGTITARNEGAEVGVSGRIAADIVQRCVATLAPLNRRLDIPFERIYSAALRDEWDMYGADAEDIFLDLEDELVAEPLPEAGVDLGDIVAEEMALHIDPYPRAAAVAAAVSEGAPSAEDAQPRVLPFSDLAERLSKR